MQRRYSINFMILAMAADYGLTFLALFLAVAIRPLLRNFPWLVPLESLQIPSELYFVVPLIWVGVFFLSSVYDPNRHHRTVDEVLAVILASGLATLIMAGFMYLLYRDFSRWLFVIFLVFDLVFLVGWRLAARYISRVLNWPANERRVLIVGAGEVGNQVESMLEEYRWEGLTFFGYLDDDPQKMNGSEKVLGPVSETRRIVTEQHISDVIIALPQRAYGRINNLIVDLHELPVQVRVVPDYFSIALHRATVENFGALPMINLRDPALSTLELTIKRLFDLVLGSIITLISLPLMGLTALLIRWDSPGPVLFKQRRIGENGRPFTMLKFRSMFDGAEQMQHELLEINDQGEIIFKSENDPRVTRLGYYLRRFSLDEMPQLFNVLKGEMSLVGPRPELPSLAEHYESWQRKRFAVPQGITGWWQISGRSTRPTHLKTADDLYYIQHYSLWLDLYILLKTVLIVLRGTGAY